MPANGSRSVTSVSSFWFAPCTMPSDRDHAEAFCGRSMDDVRKLIGGRNGCYICDEWSQLRVAVRDLAQRVS